MGKNQQEGGDRRSPTGTIVIFGASGDLTHRKLIPSLYSLSCDMLLSPHARILGVGRTQFTNEDFRRHLRDGVEKYARLASDEISANWDNFSSRIEYLVGNYDDPNTFQRLKDVLEGYDKNGETYGNHLFHMAIPPSVFIDVVEQLGKSALNHSDTGWARIIVEKPFGRDEESARSLNQAVHEVFDEGKIFRIDHYLGKETVQNLLTLRFANAIFEPIWNRNYIDHVQITVAEEVGVGDRAGYYEQAGVLRDIFQNHVMQLLALTTIEPPVAFEAETFRDKKVEILRAVRPIEKSLRGQYGGNENSKAYREENEVPSDSQTATYAALKLYIDNWRWKNVPFYLRSGKRMAAKSTSIAIQFNHVPHLMFPVEGGNDLPPNILYLCIQPNEGISLRLQTKKPGTGMSTHSADIDYPYARDFKEEELPNAYERLLVDAMHGDATLFTRGDEIELAWRIIDPVLKRWENQDAPKCHLYEPGSWGPQQADELIEEDGRHWHYGCGE